MRILLAAEFSTATEAAMGALTARPWPAGTTVEVLHVPETSHLWTLSSIEEETRRAEELVQDAVDRLQRCGIAATSLVRPGDPETVIVDRAAEMEADFVLVGSPQYLLGGVAKAVLQSAPCPVEVARSSANRSAMRILLATDGSECSLLAARSVAERPWPAGTEVRIVSVGELGLSALQGAAAGADAPDPWPGVLGPPADSGAAMEMLRTEARTQAECASRASERIVSAAGLKVSRMVPLLFESPSRVILDEAKEWNADLIVVGSHGRRGINRFLLGSVSETVAMHAECSVEVIRPAPGK